MSEETIAPPFPTGSVVTLKSGGPKMTVAGESFSTTSCACHWFDGHTLRYSDFSYACLELAGNDPTPPSEADLVCRVSRDEIREQLAARVGREMADRWLPPLEEERWVPLSERFPKYKDANISGKVLVANDKREAFLMRWDFDPRHYNRITHWMPIPKMP